MDKALSPWRAGGLRDHVLDALTRAGTRRGCWAARSGPVIAGRDRPSGSEWHQLATDVRGQPKKPSSLTRPPAGRSGSMAV